MFQNNEEMKKGISEWLDLDEEMVDYIIGGGTS
jgi:hypothetical protein